MTSVQKKFKCPLEAWDPSKIVPDWSMLVVGSRRAGKSVLIRSLLLKRPGDWLSKYDFIVVMAGNGHCAREYQRAGCPEKYIHVGLKEQLISDYWTWVEGQLKEGRPIPKTLWIFDDVLCMTSSKKWSKTRTSDCYWLGRLFNEGRHIRASVCLCIQQIGVGLRFLRCSDVACFFGSALNCGQDVKNVRQHYLPCDSKTADWILNSCYKHDVIVCEYFRQESRDWKDRIKIYRVSKDIVSYEPGAGREPSPEPPSEEPDDGRKRTDAPWHRSFADRKPAAKHVHSSVRQADRVLRGGVHSDEGQ